MATNEEKLSEMIELFKERFVNRADVMAKQNSRGKYDSQKGLSESELTRALANHVHGRETWGVYAADQERMCRWFCLDIDVDPDKLKKAKVFITDEEAICIRKETLRLLTKHLITLGVPEFCLLKEFSGRKGFHIWCFFETPTPLRAVKSFLSRLYSTMPPLHYAIKKLESFPNVNANELKPFGFLVKLPLALHRVSGNRSFFCDDDGNKLGNPIEVLRNHPKWALPESYINNPIRYEKRSKRRGKPKADPSNEYRIETPIEPPPLTADLKRLFDNCAFMRHFRDDPVGWSHDEWLHAGIVLCQFDRGAEWFAYLSMLDVAGFDGGHEDIIRNVKRHNMFAPCCSTIGCDMCGCATPMEAAGIRSNHFKSIRLGELEPIETIGLHQLRVEMLPAIEKLIKSGATGVYLIRGPMGSGKTYMVSGAIERLSKRGLWFAPTHEQADELMKCFRMPIQHIHGRTRMSELGIGGFVCPHVADIDSAAKRGLPGEEHYCHGRRGVCALRHQCAYQTQFANARDNQLIIAPHKHLQLGKRKRAELMENRDVIVLDEDFSSCLRQDVVINESDLVQLRDALKTCQAPIGSVIEQRWVTPLLDLFHAPPGSVKRLTHLDVPEGLVNQINDHFQQSDMGRNVLMDLLKAAGKSNIRIRQQKDETVVLWFTQQAYLPKDKLILILDGTGSVEYYQRLLGKGYKVREINPLGDRLLDKYTHIIQCLSGGYTNSTLLNEDESLSPSGRRVLDFIKSKLDKVTPTGIISTQKFEVHLREALKDYPNVEFAHFKNQRGLNTMSKKQVLFVVGYQGINYEDLVHETNKRFDLNLPVDSSAKQLEQDQRWVSLSYCKKGMGYNVQTLQPSDPDVSSFYRMEVVAEVEQAIGRIRPYEPGGGRMVYLLTNLPVSIPVDEVFDLNEHEAPALQSMIEAAIKLLESRECFSQGELQQAAGLGRTAIHKHRDLLCGELGLTREQRGRETVYIQTRTEALAA